jgi:hypothetical protein
MIRYPAKLSFKIDGTIKDFHDKQKIKQYLTTKPPLQKNIQRILHTENETNKTMKGQALSNHRRREDQTQKMAARGKKQKECLL